MWTTLCVIFTHQTFDSFYELLQKRTKSIFSCTSSCSVCMADVHAHSSNGWRTYIDEPHKLKVYQNNLKLNINVKYHLRKGKEGRRGATVSIFTAEYSQMLREVLLKIVNHRKRPTQKLWAEFTACLQFCWLYHLWKGHISENGGKPGLC